MYISFVFSVTYIKLSIYKYKNNTVFPRQTVGNSLSTKFIFNIYIIWCFALILLRQNYRINPKSNSLYSIFLNMFNFIVIFFKFNFSNYFFRVQEARVKEQGMAQAWQECRIDAVTLIARH